eukprot:m.240086 g.240086  ORF g.240086 m.240086 type:complete len:281 (+) comp19408_c0_seq3:546-1388(+)
MAAAVAPTVTRVKYETCPLCEIPLSNSQAPLVVAPCMQHPSWSPELPGQQPWLRCDKCGHVFTDGFFDERGLAIVFRKALSHQVIDFESVEKGRLICAPIVERVSRFRSKLGGRWLDVGTGNGALFTTAAEFGYDAMGLDSRQEPVTLLQRMGYSAVCSTFEAFGAAPGSFDVISMADVLEHMPYPKVALTRAHELLNADGLLFLSMPNYDCLTWKVMDQTGQNPYWGEIEHFHNFSRASLTRLLNSHHFDVVGYQVSQRYRACMEITARKAPAPIAPPA